MKRIIQLMVLAIVAVACQPKEKSFTLNANLMGAAEKELVIVIAIDGEFTPVDTIAIESEMLNWSYELKGETMMHIAEIGTRNGVMLYVDNNEFNLSGEFAKLSEVNIETKSSAYAEFKAYTDMLKPMNSKLQEASSTYRTASSKEDKEVALKWYEECKAELDSTTKNYIKENSTKPFAAYVAYSTERRGSTMQIKNVLNVLDESLAGNGFYKALSDRLAILERVAVGKKAPDFTLNNPEGNPVALSSIKSKLLLIDFWASWCGPCRQENPNVVAIYKDYSSKGFDILGVSLDKDKAKWLKAIEDDKLSWNHVSDLKGWESEVVAMYAVAGIPHTILLDENGNIVAKNLRGDELRNKVSEYLD